MPTYLDLNSVRPAENAGLFLSQAPGTPIKGLVVNSPGEPESFIMETPMSEPLSGSATAHAAVTTATFAGFWANTEAGVILGALAGALIYVLTSHNLSAIERVLFGVASFISGILGAPTATRFINSIVGQYIPGTEGSGIPESLGAMIAAASMITIVLAIKKRAEKKAAEEGQ